jgi:hypothetical protein
LFVRIIRLTGLIFLILKVKTDYFIERDSQVPVFDRSFNCLQHMGTLQPFEKQKIAVILIDFKYCISFWLN